MLSLLPTATDELCHGVQPSPSSASRRSRVSTASSSVVLRTYACSSFPPLSRFSSSGRADSRGDLRTYRLSSSSTTPRSSSRASLSPFFPLRVLPLTLSRFHSPASECYVVFGEAKPEDASAQFGSQFAQMAQQEAQNQAAGQAQVEGGEEEKTEGAAATEEGEPEEADSAFSAFLPFPSWWRLTFLFSSCSQRCRCAGTTLTSLLRPSLSTY